MAIYYSPKISTDGLVLYYDVGNSKSYPGSGTTIADLSGNGRTGTLYNGPVYSSASGGYLSFDGLNDYIGCDSPSDRFTWTPSGAGLNFMSIEIVLKTSDSSGRIFSKAWNGNGEYNYWVDASGFGCSTGGNSSNLSCTSFATGQWEHFVYIITPLTQSVFRRGAINAGPTAHGRTSNTTPSGNGNLPLAIMTLYPYGGVWENTGHAILGDLATFKIYNRALTSSEVATNYAAIKGRFGMP